MCGIAGLVDWRGIERAAVEPRLHRALERLRPRGPDAAGTHVDEVAAFANTRLAIQDLSNAGALPMARHGRVIAYNGEVYNFPALREELLGLGHRFDSAGDTEVLLAGWQQWGQDLLPRLVGMFAFALLDPETRELYLVRDRFGKKPLLFHGQGPRIGFGSDLIALEAMLGEHRPLDMATLRLYLALRWVPEPYSIAADVHKLPPGHIARFSETGMDMRRWYDLAASRPPRYADEATAQRDLVTRFDEAVADRLVADVPVGVYLSGGIDSALTAASMVRRAGRVRSFTVGFRGAADYYEERPAAARIARHLGTEHSEIEVTPADALHALDAMFDGLDEPFADSSALPSFLLARETRRHVTVALSGDGGDEAFGGYRKYQGELWAERYRAIPSCLRAGLIEPLAGLMPEGKASPLLERARRLRRFVAEGGKDAVGRQAGWLRSLSDDEVERLAGAAPRPPVEAMIATRRDDACDDDPLNRMLHADLTLSLPSDMLVKVDRMSMANGLEVRCPFLDHRVVECAAAMPGAFKLARGEGKRVLRRAFADRLPADVFTLPKKGFELPIASWLTNELDDLTRRAIDPARLKRQGLFAPELPRRWYDALASGKRDTSEKLWTLIAFQAWCERHRPALAP
ncbi:MAG: asparagine synthase (glutamine-hydrolyzing) [Alphaproteobacteria bacterium]